MELIIFLFKTMGNLLKFITFNAELLVLSVELII